MKMTIPMNQSDATEMYGALSPVVSKLISLDKGGDELFENFVMMGRIMLMNPTKTKQEVDAYFTAHSDLGIQQVWQSVKKRNKEDEIYNLAIETQRTVLLSEERMKAFLSLDWENNLREKYKEIEGAEYNFVQIHTGFRHILASNLEAEAAPQLERELDELKKLTQETLAWLEKKVTVNSPDKLIQKVNSYRRLNAVLNGEETYNEIKRENAHLITYNNIKETEFFPVEEENKAQLITNFNTAYGEEKKKLLEPLGVTDHILSAVDSVIAKFVNTVDTILHGFTERSRLHASAKAENSSTLGIFPPSKSFSVRPLSVKKGLVEADKKIAEIREQASADISTVKAPGAA